jgi:hypothetical protein
MNSRQHRALQFRAKAEKWVRWARTTYAEFYAHSEAVNMDDVDRAFTTMLFQLTTAHDALAAAANAGGLKKWAEQLDSLRNTDELLLYVWKARDTETHDALVKWHPNANRVSVRTVDPIKLAATVGARMHAQDDTLNNHILLFLYDATDLEDLSRKMEARYRPSRERQERAGVRLTHTESLSLAPFTTRDKKGRVLHIKSPELHNGVAIEPSAHGAINSAINFYDAKLAEITGLLGHHHASAPQSLPSQQP